MAELELRTGGPIAYREAVPEAADDKAPVVCVHGFPESSLMWEPLMEALADAGHHAYAPDLYGFGDSKDFGPATFENSRERFAAWIDELGLDKVVLVVHDWGGFVGLSWACDHQERIAGLVVSDTGFFADGKWHGMAKALRSDQGEALIGALNREGFAGLLNTDGKTTFSEAKLDAYWAPFERGDGQRSTLEFYRSMDFEKLEPWQGKLAGIGAPTLILWGTDDPFAPLAGAHRFEREIPGAKLVALDGVGHFVFDEEPQRCAKEVLDFLA
jgi:haloalkane dehalogenase